MNKAMRLVFSGLFVMVLNCTSYEVIAEEINTSIYKQSETDSKTTPEITIIEDDCRLEVYLKFSPDGRELARVPLFGPTYLSDTSNYSNKVRSFKIDMRMVDYSSDGSKMVTAEGTDGARIWDARAKGTRLINIKIDELCMLDAPLKVLELPNKNRSARVFWAEFSPNNKYVLTTQANGHVKVWNTDSWSVESDITLTKDEVRVATFSPDSKSLVIGDIKGGLYQWDMEKKTEIKRIKLEGGDNVAVMGLVFADDGKKLITSHLSRTYPEVKIWDTRNWTFQTEKNFRCVAVSSSGKILAMGGYGKIKLIDLVSNNTIKVIDIIDTNKNSPEFIQTLAFSPNTRLLAVGSIGPLRLVSINLE